MASASKSIDSVTVWGIPHEGGGKQEHGKMPPKDGSSEITATAAKLVLHGHENNDRVKTQPESDYS